MLLLIGTALVELVAMLGVLLVGIVRDIWADRRRGVDKAEAVFLGFLVMVVVALVLLCAGLALRVTA